MSIQWSADSNWGSLPLDALIWLVSLILAHLNGWCRVQKDQLSGWGSVQKATIL